MPSGRELVCAELAGLGRMALQSSVAPTPEIIVTNVPVGPDGSAGIAGRMRVRSLIVVGVVSRGVAIALLIAAVDPSRTLAVIRQARPEPLVLAIGILAVQVVVRSARWWLLLGRGGDGAHLPFWLVLRALLIGYLGNAALPARLGEAARAGVIARAAHRAFGAVLGSVLLERLIDLSHWRCWC